MKRFIPVLLAGVLATCSVTCIAGCTNPTDSDSSSTTQTTQSEPSFDAKQEMINALCGALGQTSVNYSILGQGKAGSEGWYRVMVSTKDGFAHYLFEYNSSTGSTKLTKQD